jgi:sirohydrochlorin cobaltochelatase
MIAYLLVAHGSRDPYFAQSVNRVAAACARSISTRSISTRSISTRSISTTVGAAYLELAATSLTNQITVFARQLGCQELRILPLFLAPGVHSSIDLPAAIQEAQAELESSCQLVLLEPLGHSMASILQPIRDTLPVDTVFLAHGSRHAGDFLLDLARSLRSTPAFWAIFPPTAPEATLANQVTDLVKSGVKSGAESVEIGVLLYFLFPGKTSTAIEAAISELKLRFPHSHIRSTALLGEDPTVIQKMGQLLLGSEFGQDPGAGSLS